MRALFAWPLALHLLAFRHGGGGSPSQLLPVAHASSAAGQDTLVGVVGRDFVVLGADSSSSSSIAVTSSNLDKIAVVVDPFPLGEDREEEEEAAGEGSVLAPPGADGGDWDGRRRASDRDAEEGDGDRRFAGTGRVSEERRQRAVAVAAAGDAADADRLLGVLAAHAAVREYEAGVGCDVECVFDGRREGGIPAESSMTSPAGLDATSIAHLARGEIASSLRSGRGHLKVCLLVAGMVRCSEGGRDAGTALLEARSVGDATFSGRIRIQVEAAAKEFKSKKEDEGWKGSGSTMARMRPPFAESGERRTLLPRLFWLDEYGSLQSLEYGAHGFGANFALSILDRGYQPDLTREEAIDLVRDCFDQLRTRYIINSPQPPCIKCVDANGCRLVR